MGTGLDWCLFTVFFYCFGYTLLLAMFFVVSLGFYFSYLSCWSSACSTLFGLSGGVLPLLPLEPGPPCWSWCNRFFIGQVAFQLLFRPGQYGLCGSYCLGVMVGWAGSGVWSSHPAAFLMHRRLGSALLLWIELR